MADAAMRGSGGRVGSCPARKWGNADVVKRLTSQLTGWVYRWFHHLQMSGVRTGLGFWLVVMQRSESGSRPLPVRRSGDQADGGEARKARVRSMPRWRR